VTSPIYLILKRHGLTAPDRRPLHAYAATDAEFADLAAAVGSDRPLALYAPLFVLWASEEIRRNHGAGNLSWFFLLEHLGIQHRQDLGRQWVSEGLDFWKRPLRRRASDGKTLFLYSLLAEGGLPDAFLSRDSGYAAALLGAIADIEREALGLTDVAGLDRIAAFRSSGLPAALQGQESCALLRDLALAFVDLRRDLPARIDIDAALLWLDRNRSGWAEKLPLRLSQEARQALLLPALARQIERPVSGALAQRLLLPSAGGTAWTGVLRILRGGLLPYGLLPKVDRGFVLRLVAADGSALRAHPDLGGWRVEAARDLKLALYPWAPAVLSAYADGRALGEVVIDPGLPEPGESALLWRSEGSGQVRALVPSVGGRTRSDRLWLLSSVEPVVSDGLQLDPPLPGPGGKVWPISGRGRVIVGNELVDIVTGSEEDEPGARFLVLAELARLVRVEGGLPAYIGTPRFLGARAELSMRDVTAAVQVAEGRGLGIRRFDWVEGGERIASTRAVFLPADLDVTLREAGQNLAIEVRGLPLNWRLAVLLDGSRHVLPQGAAAITLDATCSDRGEVVLEFFDPQGGLLRLRKPWPSREPLLLDPAGRRLTAPRQLSLRALPGWYGILPGRGAVELRMPKAPRSLAFVESGMIRLAAWRSLLAQVQALTGADGRVDLTLATDRPTPLLKISRHDWEVRPNGLRVDLGDAPVQLHASTLAAPVLRRQVTAQGLFDLAAWLVEGEALWFVQGSSARGVMRPFPFCAKPRPFSHRDQRIAGYLDQMAQMMKEPGHPGWLDLVEVMEAARAGGDCGSLDQVQALGAAPEVAVALLLRSQLPEVAAMLELETEAPIWWPAVPISAWAKGIGAGLAWVEAGLALAGFDPAATRDLAQSSIARTAGRIVELRPELSGHLGLGMHAHGLAPLALGSDGKQLP